MSGSMHIVTIAETGHIVAAVAQTSTSGDPDAMALVGRDLPIWQPRDRASADTATQSLLPVEILEVKSVPSDAAVIAHPLGYVVDGGRVVPLPAAALVSAADITLAADTITLKKGAPKTAGLAVVTDNAGTAGSRRVQSGEVSPNGDDLVLALSILPGEGPANLGAGNYRVMVAMAGKRLTWITENLP
jgi:hypothetical protein